MNIVMLSKIQEHMRRGAQFFTISTMQKTQKKKHGGVLIKLYLMTKNTLAQDYPNHFARFDIYAQNFTAFMLSQFLKVIMITRMNL